MVGDDTIVQIDLKDGASNYKKSFKIEGKHDYFEIKRRHESYLEDISIDSLPILHKYVLQFEDFFCEFVQIRMLTDRNVLSSYQQALLVPRKDSDEEKRLENLLRECLMCIESDDKNLTKLDESKSEPSKDSTKKNDSKKNAPENKTVRSSKSVRCTAPKNNNNQLLDEFIDLSINFSHDLECFEVRWISSFCIIFFSSLQM